MKKLFFSLAILFVCTSFRPASNAFELPFGSGYSVNLCKSGNGGEAKSGEISVNGTNVGYIIVLNRSSKRIKAKYFANQQNGESVHNRYDEWRKNKNIILISSGAYADGFQNTNVPIGLTVDAGNKVNDTYESSMDGLVIVEEVGGVRISNIEDGDLKIWTNNVEKTIDIRNSYQKTEFLRWCGSEKATVFQTHLLIYKNQLKFAQADTKKAIRKMFLLAKDASGNIYHIIVYIKNVPATLYEMASFTLQTLNSEGYEIIAGANLDTGSMDVLSTSTELGDCSGGTIEGFNNSKRHSMSNMLSYYYE